MVVARSRSSSSPRHELRAELRGVDAARHATTLVEPAVEPPIEALQLGDAGRVRVVREIMGAPDATLRPFPAGVRHVVFADHARFVEPLILRHWPECLAERAGRKLRFLTCNLYATAPWTVLFSAPNPPRPVGLCRSLGAALGFEPRRLSSLAGITVRAAAAMQPIETRRRIIVMASFIATIDHVYDHLMSGLPAHERGRRLRALLDGTWAPAPTEAHAGAFRLVRALYDDMRAGVQDEQERAQLDRALRSLSDYVEAEVKALTGVDDPSGCCWRMPGVLGTIDGLIFPVHRYAGETAREWMYSVSLFVQVLDDWLDAEKDAGDIRPTPILTGHWTKETLRDVWERTLDGIVNLARESGVHDDKWLAFVRETYRMMAIETAEAMSGGGAA